jgi:hypothetical protein
MSKLTLKQLKKQLDHVEYYNMMSPFPIYDTEYVAKIKETMDAIEKSKENYDELPVVACNSCKSLHIIVDEVENSICMKCNSMNDLIEFKDIHEYKRSNNIWND